MQRMWALKQGSCFSLLAGMVLLVSFGAGRIVAQTVLEVEPGLKIPNAKTPWAVDVFENRRQLVPIHHSNITLNKHTGSNIGKALTESVFAKTKITMELDGLSSRNQLHSERPVLYFLLEEDQDPGGQGKSSDVYDDFVIARVEQKKEKRVVDQLQFTQVTGKAKRTENYVETEKTVMSDGWVRIQPKAPMPEGEYVLLPIPKVNGTFSTVVWDFGVHAKAANAKDAIPSASEVKRN